jgi:hypothetical protein
MNIKVFSRALSTVSVLAGLFIGSGLSAETEFLIDADLVPSLADGLNEGDSITRNGITLTFSNVIFSGGNTSADVGWDGLIISSLVSSDATATDAISFDITFDQDVTISAYTLGALEDVPSDSYFTLSGGGSISALNQIPTNAGFSGTPFTANFNAGTISKCFAGVSYTFAHNFQNDDPADPIFWLKSITVSEDGNGGSSNYAPSAETVATLLPGEVINGASFTSSTRFNWNGELGNWSYVRSSPNIGYITQTYDEDDNDPNIYREETVLTFFTATTGIYVYSEYEGNELIFSESGPFDFPLLEEVSGPPVWEPQGWVYFSWPYAYSITEGRWHFFNASGNQSRVDLSTGIWGPFNQSSGWQYFSWPYTYSTTDSTWYWHNAGATQWVVDLTSGIWARLGQSGN